MFVSQPKCQQAEQRSAHPHSVLPLFLPFHHERYWRHSVQLDIRCATNPYAAFSGTNIHPRNGHPAFRDSEVIVTLEGS